MESLLRQGKQVCPFLKRSSPASLRMLATSFQTTSHGYRVSALQTAARQCPVIGKALIVQQQKRDYITKSATVAVGEESSLEEAHRAAGVTDLSKGNFSVGEIGLMEGICPHAAAARKAYELTYAGPAKFDYEAFYAKELDKKHKDKSYRYFNNINRVTYLLWFG